MVSLSSLQHSIDVLCLRGKKYTVLVRGHTHLKLLLIGYLQGGKIDPSIIQRALEESAIFIH